MEEVLSVQIIILVNHIMHELNDKDFTIKSDGIYVKHKMFKDKQGLLFFKAEWCGHCQRAKPELQQVSDAVGMAFPVCMIDCDKNTKVTKAIGIEGFPTFKYVNRQGKITTDYNGSRDSQYILEAICKKAKVCKRN